jgi:hypothetical protein
VLSVFQAHHHTAAKPGIDFIHVVEVQESGAVDANKTPRIDLLFQVSNAVVNDVIFRRDRLLGARPRGASPTCDSQTRGTSPMDTHDQSPRASQRRKSPADESHPAVPDRTLVSILVVCEPDHRVQALARHCDDSGHAPATSAASCRNRRTNETRRSGLRGKAHAHARQGTEPTGWHLGIAAYRDLRTLQQAVAVVRATSGVAPPTWLLLNALPVVGASF